MVDDEEKEEEEEERVATPGGGDDAATEVDAAGASSLNTGFIGVLKTQYGCGGTEGRRRRGDGRRRRLVRACRAG
jgi:hypothetical protein